MEAETYFKKALNLNPNDAVSHLEISIFYVGIKKDSQKALYHARQAFETNPFSVDCFFNLANILIENDKLEEAKTLFESKKGILPTEAAENFSSFLPDAEAKDVLKKGEDWTNSIEIYNNAISKSEGKVKSNLYQFLGRFYDTYLNDDQNYVLYLKKAIELDSIDSGKIADYYNALLENKQFKDAELFSKSPMYVNSLTENAKKTRQFYYYYHQNKNKEALEQLKDTVFDNNVLIKLLIYSQMGNKNKVYELIKNEKPIANAKAFAFANLKEKDSMYFYMDKVGADALIINSRREFDPYRKEPRYIEFLKKNHIPIIEKYNGKIE